MCEEARVADLQEKMRGAKRKVRGGWVIFIIGLILVALGFGVGGQFETIVGIIGFGAVFSAVGIVQAIYFTKQYPKLLDELKGMTGGIPKCPNCGKEPPNDHFALCPFCGKPLKR